MLVSVGMKFINHVDCFVFIKLFCSIVLTVFHYSPLDSELLNELQSQLCLGFLDEIESEMRGYVEELILG